MNWLLKRLAVYPNAYYNYKKHRKNAKQKEKASIQTAITKIYHDAGGRPGYRMMQQLLENKGLKRSTQTVRKYMNVELGLKSVTRKPKYRYCNGPQAFGTFENLLNRNFKAEKRNTRWCVDFTYLFLSNHSKRYNCTIIDLYDRRVVASVCSRKINAQLAIDTLSKALESCGNPNEVMLHSDRGSQFTSKEFIEFCKAHHVTQSMSRPGCPYDNSPMERYFNTLKAELIRLKTFKTEEQLYTEVTAYAYGWYNNQRPHTANNGLPPAKVA